MIQHKRVDRGQLAAFLKDVAGRLERPAHLYLIGESALVLAGAREATEEKFVYTASAADIAALAKAIAASASASGTGIEVQAESPAEVVPTPDGAESRARSLEEWQAGPLKVSVYDPYGAAIRLVARGDEPDYHAVVGYMRLGWMTMEELDRLVETLIARFTKETIAQDPEEFRRKLKGLRQMWRADVSRRAGQPVWQETPRGDTLTNT